jgi:hypothetical protein
MMMNLILINLKNVIMKKVKNDNQFSVSLNGIELSDEQRRRIDKGIKDVVMREIASIDNQGDFIINANIAKSPLLEKFKLPPHTLGIWAEQFESYRDRLVNRFGQ